MGFICRCFFRYCCESHGRESDDDSDSHDHAFNQRNAEGTRIQSYSSVSAYVQPREEQGLVSSRSGIVSVNEVVGLSTVSTDTTVDDDENGNYNSACCRPADPNSPSLFSFIRRNINKWHNSHGAVMDTDGDDHRGSNDYLSSTEVKKLVSSSPLRQAVSFNSSSSCDVPCTINADEIVLPGSMIQQQMAQQMILTASRTTIQPNVDECVICMEPFDATNPRIPTLCNCGINKTYFHLPCLYQYTEQNMDCPSCRTKITWEEF